MGEGGGSRLLARCPAWHHEALFISYTHVISCTVDHEFAYPTLTAESKHGHAGRRGGSSHEH